MSFFFFTYHLPHHFLAFAGIGISLILYCVLTKLILRLLSNKDMGFKDIGFVIRVFFLALHPNTRRFSLLLPCLLFTGGLYGDDSLRSVLLIGIGFLTLILVSICWTAFLTGLFVFTRYSHSFASPGYHRLGDFSWQVPDEDNDEYCYEEDRWVDEEDSY